MGTSGSVISIYWIMSLGLPGCSVKMKINIHQTCSNMEEFVILPEARDQHRGRNSQERSMLTQISHFSYSKISPNSKISHHKNPPPLIRMGKNMVTHDGRRNTHYNPHPHFRGIYPQRSFFSLEFKPVVVTVTYPRILKGPFQFATQQTSWSFLMPTLIGRLTAKFMWTAARSGASSAWR